MMKKKIIVTPCMVRSESKVDGPARARAANGVAVGAGAAGKRVRRLLRRTARLRGEPAVERAARLGDHEHRHVRVLQAAELGALAAERARAVRFEQHLVLPP